MNNLIESNNLTETIEIVEKELNDYKNMDENNKLLCTVKIKEQINKSNKILDKYLYYLENSDSFFETPEYESGEEKDKKFIKYSNKIKEIEDKINDDNLDIDKRISLYVDLSTYINWCEEYLDDKKKLNIEHLDD